MIFCIYLSVIDLVIAIVFREINFNDNIRSPLDVSPATIIYYYFTTIRTICIYNMYYVN